VFYERLARTLSTTVQTLLNNCSCSELENWRTYFSKEPWPWELQEIATANQTAWLCAVQGSKVSVKECGLSFTPQQTSEADWEQWANVQNTISGNE